MKSKYPMITFRIHIRPGGLNNPKLSFAYCIEQGLLGVGWPTYLDQGAASWEEYEAEASKHHNNLNQVRYLKNKVKKNDLIWTRNTEGEYYLARVTSEWEYLTNSEALDADIVNIVRCEILKVPKIDQVPGKVVACFRSPRTMQRIADERMDIYSRHLWNQLSGHEHYSSVPNNGGGVFSFLGAEETEDLLFVYLQMMGWLVIPNSRKADTMSFEFYLIHRETRERAIIQIKTGNSWLNTNDWTNRSERVFLFQSNGLYSGNSHPSIECISPATIQNFMLKNRDLLPLSTISWMDHVGMSNILSE